jgi:hypothetical protein
MDAALSPAPTCRPRGPTLTPAVRNTMSSGSCFRRWWLGHGRGPAGLNRRRRIRARSRCPAALETYERLRLIPARPRPRFSRDPGVPDRARLISGADEVRARGLIVPGLLHRPCEASVVSVAGRMPPARPEREPARSRWGRPHLYGSGVPLGMGLRATVQPVGPRCAARFVQWQGKALGCCPAVPWWLERRPMSLRLYLCLHLRRDPLATADVKVGVRRGSPPSVRPISEETKDVN